MTGLPTILELVCFPHVIFGTWFINVLGNFFLVNPYSLHPSFICHAQGSGVHRRHNTPWLPHCGCQNPKKVTKEETNHSQSTSTTITNSTCITSKVAPKCRQTPSTHAL